jgi:cold shock CspA family protein
LRQVSDERREQGNVQSVKEGFGFIRCADREGRMFFHFSEWLDVKRPQDVGDECEFTVAPDPNQPGRNLATRIKRLPPGATSS